MTKRMLSLLLALVMTLSLCVPALAADEFAAEPVAEVEEQAPEAPEAPVEPEAEVEEEPVVDEPAMEEADAPEIAAVIAEDEPEVVATEPTVGTETAVSSANFKTYLEDSSHTNLKVSGAVTLTTNETAIAVGKKSVTLDLNGKELKAYNGGDTTITVPAGAALTITNSVPGTQGTIVANTNHINFKVAGTLVIEKNVAYTGGATVEVSDGGKVEFKNDTVSLTTSLTAEGESSVTVNDCALTIPTVTMKGSSTIAIADGSATVATKLELKDGGLTLTDGAYLSTKGMTIGDAANKKTGSLAVTDSTIVMANAGDKITLDAGTATFTGASVTAAATNTAELIEVKGGTLTVNSGTYENTGAFAVVKATPTNKFTVTIEDGTFKSTGKVIETASTGASDKSGCALTIKDGTFTSTGSSGVVDAALSSDYVTYSIEDGLFVASSGNTVSVSGSNAVKGGVFVPQLAAADGGIDATTKCDEADEYVVPSAIASGATLTRILAGDTPIPGESGTKSYTVMGKTLSETTVAGLKEGTAIVLSGSAAFSSVKPNVTVAKGGKVENKDVTIGGVALDKYAPPYEADDVVAIGTQGYKSVKEAIEEAKSGETITFLKDIKLDGSATTWVNPAGSGEEDVKVNGDLTFDLNECTLTIDSTRSMKLSYAADVTGTHTVTFKNGNIIGNSDQKITAADADIVLDDVYCSAALESGTAGARSITLKNESIVDAAIGSGSKQFKNVTIEAKNTAKSTINANGAVVVAGTVLDGITVSFAAGSVTLQSTASVEEVKVDGASCKFTVEDGAEITGAVTIASTATSTSNTVDIKGGSFGGDVTIGATPGQHFTSISISGGEFDETVAIDAAASSEVSVTGGVFNDTTTSIKTETASGTAAQVITGGAFYANPADSTNYVAAKYGAVQIEDTATYTAPAKTPLGDTNKYYFVGKTADEALALITKGNVVGAGGTATLASVGDDMKITTSVANAAIKVGKVTLKDSAAISTAVTGEKVNELNELITKAAALKLNTTLTSDQLSDLVEAYDEATGELKSAAAVNTAIRHLTQAMEGLEAAPSKENLNAAITAAEALKQADYTAASWTPFATALAAAKTVAANANATEAEIKTAMDNLKAAQDALVKATTPSTDIPPAPKSGTGWMQSETTGDIYFYKDGVLKKGYWVGKVDGASKWDNTWYYVGADGKLATGFQYIDDLHGGYGWYMLQTTNDKGQIGKMLTGYQWTYTAQGEGYFSAKSGESGKCTWNQGWGSYNAATKLWADGLAHAG